MFRSSFMKFFMFFMVLLAIPLLTILSQQIQDNRQHAAGPEEHKSQEEHHESQQATVHENDDHTKHQDNKPPSENKPEQHNPAPTSKPVTTAYHTDAVSPKPKVIVYNNSVTNNTIVYVTTYPSPIPTSKLTPTKTVSSTSMRYTPVPTMKQCTVVKVPVTNIQTNCQNCTIN